MLSNSVAASALTTVYVLTLFLQLNPALELTRAGLRPLFTTIGVFYGLHLTAICYVLLVARQIAAREVFSPAWFSVGVLSWLGAIASAAGASLMWANVTLFETVLDPRTVSAMTTGTLALAAAAIAFAVLVALRRWAGSDPRFVWATLFAIIAFWSAAVPLIARGRGRTPPLEARPIDTAVDGVSSAPTARVTVVAIDAASLGFITAAAVEGRLPNFGRLLDAGASMQLTTIHPTSEAAVWAAVATGKLPQKNGVRSEGVYHVAGGGALSLLPAYCFARGLIRFGFLLPEAHTSATLRVRTLWGILSTQGLSAGVVGWPLTDPPPAIRGYVVSDVSNDSAEDVDGAIDAGELAPRFAAAGRKDRLIAAAAREHGRTHPVTVTLTRYQGLDPIGHYFLRFATPAAFGDVTDEERRTRGPILERHYGIVDEEIGRAIAALGPDDLLVVVSGYGMEPLPLWQRLIERAIGDPELSGTHDDAPDGFLLAYGSMVSPGRRMNRASVVDVAPTILYFLGLPVARDMDGYARSELFQASFTDDRPITFIPTYER
jgi:hypothetical protein